MDPAELITVYHMDNERQAPGSLIGTKLRFMLLEKTLNIEHQRLPFLVFFRLADEIGKAYFL